MKHTYWADLHNHNDVGYGRGSLERSFRIAQETLDVYSLSVHGHWPDAPTDDPQVANYHREAFEGVRAAFPAVVQRANAANHDGKFVAFLAYEWHSSQWGDYVVIFPGETAEVHRASSLKELQLFVRGSGAIMIPHHVGYQLGCRGLDWSGLDPELSPVVEIFSEHGNSLESDGLWPMLAHSMGGVAVAQSGLENLRRGRRFGLTAGTDTHFGHPGCYGEGLTAVLAEKLTRADILSALRQRHTYAVTGDRIGLTVDANGATMGDALPANTARKMRIGVDPLGPLEYVQVLKNGQSAAIWAGRPGDVAPRDQRVLCRIDWGWGRMEDADTTLWNITIRVHNGSIVRALPHRVTGTDDADMESHFRQASATEIQVLSCTSRRHPLPISGAVIEIDAGADLIIECDASTDTSGEKGGTHINATRATLADNDVSATILPRFSSPRLRVGRLRSKAGLAVDLTWEDPTPGADDFYLIKAQQKNGQLAWSSPLWFGGEGA